MHQNKCWLPSSFPTVSAVGPGLSTASLGLCDKRWFSCAVLVPFESITHILPRSVSINCRRKLLFFPVAGSTQPKSTCLGSGDPPNLVCLQSSPPPSLQPRKALRPLLCRPSALLPCLLQHTASSPPLFKFVSQLVCTEPHRTPLYLLRINTITSMKPGTACEISLGCSRTLDT